MPMSLPLVNGYKGHVGQTQLELQLPYSSHCSRPVVSASLTLQPFSTLPHAVVTTPNHEIILNAVSCDFAILVNVM